MRVERQSQVEIKQIQNEKVETSEPSVGRGYSGKSGNDTDLLTVEQGTPDFQYVFRSLSLMIQTGSHDEIEVALVEIMEALGKVLSDIEEDKIVMSQEQIRASLESKLEKLEEADKKLQRALRKDKGSGTWGKLKIAGSFLTAIATMAVGAAMVAGTGGIYAPGVAMMLSGGLQFVLAADSLCQELTGHGMMGNFILLVGGSEERARNMDMAFRIYVMLAILACAVMSGVGAAAAGGTSASSVSATLMIAKAVVAIASSLMTISTAAGDTYYAVRGYEAADLNRDSKYLRADAQELEAMIAMIMELIDSAFDHLRSQQNGTTEIIGRMLEVQMDTSNSLARTKI